MTNRHERRKAATTSRKKLPQLNAATLDQHFEDALRRVRTEFERTGEMYAGFECVTDVESFQIPAYWPDRGAAKAQACAALRDSFRRRKVNRYVFASEGWVGKTPGFRSTDDPDRGECVQVIAVERNGLRRYAFAEITRNGATASLGPWKVSGDVPRGWLLELLEDGYSDRPRKEEPPPVPRLSARDVQTLMYEDPAQGTEFRESFEICDQLGDLLADQIQDADSDALSKFMALESILRSIVQDMGSPKDIGAFARFLRDHPDSFPMFSIVSAPVPSAGPEHLRHCKATLQHFICEKREAGHTLSALFGAFMNMYLYVGSQAIGALKLADCIENWDPEHQAKLRQVGLRSSFELDDEEGCVFIALSADRYPVCVMGRRNAVGDLFVTGLATCPEGDFATAVDKIKQMGFELLLGSEAKELFCKMEQVEGVALRAKPKEIWEVENWGHDEWTKQTLAELVFAEVMNVEFVPDPTNRHGVVAGYRVRCAPDGLVLIPSDSDEDIFVAVIVEITKRRACVLGWLRASEGKLPQFYQKNYWFIPPEALHPMETLPGKERLLAMPPYQEPDLNDLPNDGD